MSRRPTRSRTRLVAKPQMRDEVVEREEVFKMR